MKNVIIVGAGEVGYNLASHLISEKKNVVLIDKDSEKVKYTSAHLDCIVIKGAGNNIDILEEAGIENCDIFISATDSDEVNLISCFIVANEFNVPLKIARVRNLDYSRKNFFNKSGSGIDFLVNPEIEASKSIVNSIVHGAVSDVFTFEGTSIQLRDVYIDDESDLIGMSLIELRKKYKFNFIVAGILRNEDILIPFGETKIKEGDNLYIVGDDKNLEMLFKKLGIKRKRIKDVVIVGGGRIGELVAKDLLTLGKNIMILEKDYDRCKELSEKYESLLVINADITDKNVYEEENIRNYDLLISATGNEELNILTSIYAKKIGVKRSIAIVNKTNYLSLASGMGIDATVSTKISSVNAILKFIRKGKVKSVYSIFDGKAEAMEITVKENSVLANKVLKDIDLPKGALIVAINRGSDNFIPDGNSKILAGDNIIIFALKNVVDKIEELISS
ncbi:Trk system potassium transporter TrkA [Deferribacter autotrophicus]|uniref:Trk system potassium uptake protein TrkA n=1 Tax=Deferribacter autotrophicus TaxID=500465 RepID=A0A5A8F1K8_9BACT|nr:Trk system potassium transporter TrkA [Deferribacter autotrophicus]KAA0257990.1 Trk system potassium transporter TrkA [Deferribacter autotrophicus]